MRERLPHQSTNPAPSEPLEEPSTPPVEATETPNTQPESQEMFSESKQEVKQKFSTAEDIRNRLDRVKGNTEVGLEEKFKEYKRLELEVADRRTELEQGVRSEQSQLQEARARLGMAEAPRQSHSARAVANEIRDLNMLDDDIRGELREVRNAQASLERERGIKEGARDMSEAVAAFASEINNRERNGMDPFMDAKAFNELRTGAFALSRFAEAKERMDTNELGSAFSRINAGLDGMERMRRSGPIRETEESLSKLGFAMRTLYEGTDKLSRNFREGDEDAAIQARKLMQNTERVAGFTSRLRSSLRNMR